jgi:hypothetical protein
MAAEVGDLGVIGAVHMRGEPLPAPGSATGCQVSTVSAARAQGLDVAKRSHAQRTGAAASHAAWTTKDWCLVLAWGGCVGTAPSAVNDVAWRLRAPCRSCRSWHRCGVNGCRSSAASAGSGDGPYSCATKRFRIKGLSCPRKGAVMPASGGPNTLQRCEPWAMVAKADRGDGHAAALLPHA